MRNRKEHGMKPKKSVCKQKPISHNTRTHAHTHTHTQTLQEQTFTLSIFLQNSQP